MMKVIITGATGMVGRATMIECIESSQVEQILLINRKPLNWTHPKVKEVTLKDFSDFSPIKEQLRSYDACFHCMGVSAVGMNQKSYSHITYNMTKALADILYEINPNMVFNYVSGRGTDSSEKGMIMWARVKGKTENYILSKGFKDAYAFRPGAILPEKGVKSKTGWYNLFYVITKPVYPLLRRFKSVTPSSNVGKAMIKSVLLPGDKKHIESSDINYMADL